VSSSFVVVKGGVRARVRVGARGSWDIERRGGGRSSEEGVERRDCKSGGGGDKDESSSSGLDVFVRAVIAIEVAGASFASAFFISVSLYYVEEVLPRVRLRRTSRWLSLLGSGLRGLRVSTANCNCLTARAVCGVATPVVPRGVFLIVPGVRLAGV
jgi:hypothetical protein